MMWQCWPLAVSTVTKEPTLIASYTVYTQLNELVASQLANCWHLCYEQL